MRIALCTMAKALEPGWVRTRPCPPPSPDDAADLRRCFLLDTVAQARGVARFLAYAPADLVRLPADLAAGPDHLPPPHTRRFVSERPAGRTAGAGGRI